MTPTVLLELSADQQLLQEAAARFIDAACPLGAVRELADAGVRASADYLSQAAELGWYAPFVPEALGGGSVSGSGVVDLAVVAVERGRVLQPGPFLSMNVVAAAVAASGSQEQQAEFLPLIAAGQTIAAWMPSGPFDPSGSRPGVRAVRAGDEFVLSGHVGLVQDATDADLFLVTAGDGQPTQFLVRRDASGLGVHAVAALDITQRCAAVELQGVRVGAGSVLGQVEDAGADAERQLQLALVLNVAETIGALDALFEMARQYALDRIAFGRPIGSFQAVKHQLADMSLSLEAGKAVLTAAVEAVQAGRADAGEIASMAKAWVGDVGIDIAQGTSQVFGGIGQTWDHDSHLFVRRVTMNSVLWGSPAWHRERICARQGL